MGVILPSGVTGVDSDGVGELIALAALGPPRGRRTVARPTTQHPQILLQ
jgi:hypothetical protein